MSKKKIIILEDEEVIGKIFTKKLEASGFSIKWTKTVEETEKLLEHSTADIFLLDHGIRGQERAGISLVPSIKKAAPKAKIIILSNYSHSDLQKEAFICGIDSYLIKINTSPQSLVKHIESLF